MSFTGQNTSVASGRLDGALAGVGGGQHARRRVRRRPGADWDERLGRLRRLGADGDERVGRLLASGPTGTSASAGCVATADWDERLRRLRRHGADG